MRPSRFRSASAWRCRAMDLHKEIKLSDLFKRGSKDDGEAKAEKAPGDAKPPKEKRRKEPKPPKERRKSSVAVAAHEAPPLPEIPLMRAFNLLPREEARAAKEDTSPLPYVLVALAGVLVFAALAAFYLMAGTDVTKKKGQIEDLRAELAAYQATAEQPSVEDKSASLAAERAGRTNSLSNALANRLAWDRILRELALVIPPNVALSTITSTAPAAPTAVPAPTTAHNFTISGETEEQEDVAKLLTRLSIVPELTGVALVSAERVTNDDGDRVVRFSINASTRQGGA
jgi:Tfp pilus assembly protein PilN